MGKYLRNKSKTASEISVMEVSQSSFGGVRTRAKTLALQRLQKSSSAPVPAQPGGSYLQLRSRRLEKPPIMVAVSHRRKKQSQASARNPNPRNRNSTSDSSARSRLRQGRGKPRSCSATADSIKEERSSDEEEKETVGSGKKQRGGGSEDLGVEASFGENVLEIGERERESTPCNLIRNSEDIRTPGSTTKPSGSINTYRREENPSVMHIPTPSEMDEFFAGAEEEQQKQFMEKYNFDPVNEKPLPGRFEWEKVNH